MTKDQIAYIICCVGAFALHYKLTSIQAYAYLRRHGGIEFLIECYEAEHTLSIEDAVEDLAAVCQHRGGLIS